MTKKKKEKTAKNKGQWIAYVVFILTGAACGIFVPMYTGMAGQPEKGIFSDIMPFVLMLIGTYVAIWGSAGPFPVRLPEWYGS